MGIPARVAITLCDQMIDELTETNMENITADIDSVIASNDVNSVYACTYKGHVYKHSDYYSEVNKWSKFKELSSRFHDHMDPLIEARNQLIDARLVMRSYFAKCINICSTVADLYAIFPESIHPILRNAGMRLNDYETTTLTCGRVENFNTHSANDRGAVLFYLFEQKFLEGK